MSCLHKRHEGFSLFINPDPVIPSKSALIPCTELPIFQNVEITGSHTVRVAHSIQGGAGPGGCDATHWQDSLLRLVSRRQYEKFT